MSAARARREGLGQPKWDNATLEQCPLCGTYGVAPCDCEGWERLKRLTEGDGGDDQLESQQVK